MKKTTSAADPKTFHKLQELVREIDVAMMTTVTPGATLHSRPMVTLNFDDDGRIWFFTSDDSGTAHDLAAEQGVNLSYADPREHRYVSVTGNASVVHDREHATSLWRPALKTYFPRGLEDPHLALLEVRVETAEYWDLASSRMVQFFGGRQSASNEEDTERGEHTQVDIRAARASG